MTWLQSRFARVETALRANAADTRDDHVSENIFDIEDERTEVDIIFHGMIRGAN